MDKIFELAESAKKLSDTQAFEIAMSSSMASDEARRLLADEQMYNKGIKGDGTKIGEYSERTKQIKASKGQRYDHMTLRDTGDFHDSIHISDVSNDLAFIDSEPIKSDGTNLILKFGSEILDTTEESNEVLSKKVLPDVINYIKSTLGLN